MRPSWQVSCSHLIVSFVPRIHLILHVSGCRERERVRAAGRNLELFRSCSDCVPTGDSDEPDVHSGPYIAICSQSADRTFPVTIQGQATMPEGDGKGLRV